MISKSEKKRLKKILGHRYVSSISNELGKDGVVDSANKPYSPSMITNVMNGKEHSVLEAYIYKAAETAIAIKLKEQSKREEILKSAS